MYFLQPGAVTLTLVLFMPSGNNKKPGIGLIYTESQLLPGWEDGWQKKVNLNNCPIQ